MVDATVQTDFGASRDPDCPECQLNAVAEAATPVAMPSDYELKQLVLPMLDHRQNGRIIYVHGGTAAARTKCVK